MPAKITENKNMIPHETLSIPPSREVKTLLVWEAPGRPFKKRNKSFYMSGLLIVIFIEVILLLIHDFIAMLVAASLCGVAFALAFVPPHNFKYRISTEGIMVEDHFFLWQELYDFYFKKRYDIEVLHIRTRSLIPGEITITLGTLQKNQIKSILLRYLPYREFVKPSFMEQSGDWLSKNFPLDKPTSGKTSQSKVAS